MLSKWPIRNKLLIGIGLLLVIVAALSWSGFHSVYAYRSLVRNLRGRADELPLAASLSGQVSNLRVAIGEVRSAAAPPPTATRRPESISPRSNGNFNATCKRSAPRSTNIATTWTTTTRAIR